MTIFTCEFAARRQSAEAAVSTECFGVGLDHCTPLGSSTVLRAPVDKRIAEAFLFSADSEVVDFAGPLGVFECVSVRD